MCLLDTAPFSSLLHSSFAFGRFPFIKPLFNFLSVRIWVDHVCICSETSLAVMLSVSTGQDVNVKVCVLLRPVWNIGNEDEVKFFSSKPENFI